MAELGPKGLYKLSISFCIMLSGRKAKRVPNKKYNLIKLFITIIDLKSCNSCLKQVTCFYHTNNVALTLISRKLLIVEGASEVLGSNLSLNA